MRTSEILVPSTLNAVRLHAVVPMSRQDNVHTDASISPFLQGKSTPLYLPERRLSSPPAAAQISPINAYVTTALMSSAVPVSISCITAGHTGSAHIAR